MSFGRKAAARALRALGYELRRADRPSRASLVPALERVRALGVAPATVIDVGAAYGDWAAACHRVFPDARYVLVEPLEEFAPFLERRAQAIGSASYVRAAAAGTSGTVTLHVHPDLVGTSTRREPAAEVVGGERVVDAITVDGLVRADGGQPPYLLKADVQGGELDALAGAEETLGRSELVLLEALLFEFYEGGALLGEVVGFMGERSFVVYDLLEPGYRPLDGALAQVDLLFVPEGSPLRAEHVYARPEQRRAQNASLRARYERRLRGLGSR